MALLRDVVFKRGPTLVELIAAESTKFNLKALNKVTIRFDPFAENVQHVRLIANYLHKEYILTKNPKCLIKTEILTDRSEQTITAEAINGEKFIFKCGNLNCLEIFQLFNKYITPLAPKVEEFAIATVGKSGLLKKA